MGWLSFPSFFIIITFCWFTAIFFTHFSKNRTAVFFQRLFAFSGLMATGIFIILLWISLSRPPFRTLGETRLWYSFFLALTGITIHLRWKYGWMQSFSLVVSLIFLLLNLVSPETHNRDLMPALQSIWFIPHVIVYMIGYAMFAMAAIIAAKTLWSGTGIPNLVAMADNVVYVAFSFLTAGLLFGAFWAKQAWGHYWTWDPKETWALLTWLSYLLYIHYRRHCPNHRQTALWMLAAGFIILLLCWFGISYLPAAKNSIHLYS